MANVKSITITGTIPYNTYEYAELNSLLGQLNSPSSGLKIIYPSGCTYKPNSHGGKTAMYDFTLLGEEGVSLEWVDYFTKQVVDAGGQLCRVSVYDLQERCQLRAS